MRRQSPSSVSSSTPARRRGRMGQAFGLLPGLLAGLVALGVMPMPLGSMPVGAARQAPVLQAVAPASVRTGQPVDLGLFVTGAPGIAGLELTVGFAPGAAHFSGWTPPAGIAAGSGVALPAVETSAGVTLGFVGCALEGCVAPAGSGSISVGTISVVPDRAGRLSLGLSRVKAVDAAGSAVSLAIASPRAVMVAGDAAPSTGEPTALGGLDARIGGGGRPNRPAKDLSDDGRVTLADLPVATAEWAGARETGGACRPGSGADLNGDGCVDVADLQAQLAAVADPTGTTRMTAALAPAPVAQTAPGVFTVTSASDAADASSSDGRCVAADGTCTLRAAITESNRRAGADRIEFNIGGGGSRTIQLGSTLPNLTGGGLTIDGFTQPGAQPNTDPLVSNAVTLIAVRGKGATSATGGGFAGMFISSAGNTVRGLSVYDLNRGIRLYGTGASDNVIAGNILGTDPGATFVAPAFVGGASGVHGQAGANRNRIGGTAPADRNVVGGNAQHGIAFYDNDTDFNVIQGNLIGLAPDGSRAVRNLSHGIDLNTHTSDTTVGGTGPGERNVVAGNTYEGIEVSHGQGTLRNRVIGNYVGTDPSGTRLTSFSPNGRIGIHVEDGVLDTVVSDNIVGGNRGRGVGVNGFLTSRTSVTRNWIGITPAGIDIGNAGAGVQVTYHAAGNTLGPDNTIANNTAGIEITGDLDNDRNRITRNRTFANDGLGIDLHPLSQVNANDSGDGDSGPNEQLNHPVITAATATSAEGTACPGCTVEVFLSDADPSGHGEGREFHTSTTADSTGRFSVALGTAAQGGPITATATDATGNTSEFGPNFPVPTPPRAEPPVYARDTYTRSVSGAWGSADQGGAWTGTSSAASVSGGKGRLTSANTNATRQARLTDVSQRDVDVSASVRFDKAPAGASEYAYVTMRRAATYVEYRGRVRLGTNGKVYPTITRVTGSATETLLKSEVAVAGVSATTPLRMRVVAEGANPTTLRIRVWAEGAIEPSTWNATVTDSTPSLQGAGLVGVRTFLPSSATNAPVVALFDDFLVQGLKPAS